MHCDNYSGFDLSQALSPLRGYPVSVVYFHSEISDWVGRLAIDCGANQITGWIEKDPAVGPGWASNEIYSFDGVVLNDIAGIEGVHLITEWTNPNCIDVGRLPVAPVYNTHGNIDIGTIQALGAAQLPICDTDYADFFPWLNLGGSIEKFAEISGEVCV